jgi:hypothetical protein
VDIDHPATCRATKVSYHCNEMKNRVAKWAACSALGACHLLCGQSQAAQKLPLTLKRAEINVPMAEAGEAGLQTVLILPSTPGKRPLVLMTHGSDYSKNGGIPAAVKL